MRGIVALKSVRRSLVPLSPAFALVAVQLVFFGLPAGAWVRAVVIGLLTALLAVGMALVYRANRVLNFSQADLGFVPATLSVGLIVFNGLPYLFGFGVGLVGALVLGAIVELAIVRALNPQDTTWIPPNVSHRFRNLSDTEPMKIFWTYASLQATRTLTATGETRPVSAEHQR